MVEEPDHDQGLDEELQQDEGDEAVGAAVDEAEHEQLQRRGHGGAHGDGAPVGPHLPTVTLSQDYTGVNQFRGNFHNIQEKAPPISLLKA